VAPASKTTEGVPDGILVIDDDVKLGRVVARTLTAAGFIVTTASSGRRGLALALAHNYKLVILDLMLPDVDGFSILDRIHEQERQTQVLIMSALTDAHSKVQCLEIGACDYVTKPFDMPELVARVRLHVRGQVRKRFFDCSGYRLDLRKQRVISEDGTISLSTREFMLLEYLMRHDGEACARDQLLEQVWGYTFEPGTNVLEVYVGRLRHKLGSDCIRTVRNVGYSFAGP
jgi:DNA-binding response OmpR family regulator